MKTDFTRTFTNTYVFVKWDRLEAFAWLRSKSWPVCFSITRHAVGLDQLATFNFLEQEGHLANDEAVHSAIECGNTELVKRIVAPSEGLDEFDNYSEPEILESIFTACLDSDIFTSFSDGEKFVKEIYSLGFIITMDSLMQTIGPDGGIEYSELPITPPFIGALHGLGEVLRERGVRVENKEQYVQLCNCLTRRLALNLVLRGLP